jgi:hypothetical protein
MMPNKLTITCALLFFCAAMSLSAQKTAEKKVTYGKSTFTVYSPLEGLEPTPPCGFVPAVPGYTLKNPLYGPKTYYAYAPGNVPKTTYQCILTEIRDWIFYRPEDVEAYAEAHGYAPVSDKVMKKMFKDTRLPSSGLTYQLSDDSWIFFHIGEMQNCGPVPWGSHEPFVVGVCYLERVPQETEVVLDKLYRFWNDGVRFADNASVTQINFETRPTAPTDQNPNNFAIGDVLNPQKGFYRLSFDGGAPTYVWHKYEKVVSDNLKKPRFDAMGEIAYEDLYTAFDYSLNMVKAGKDLFSCYGVESRFMIDLLPGVTWQKEMADRVDFAKRTKVAMKETAKANDAAFEKLYIEIFK